MEKNKFEAPLMEIILFDAADIITNNSTCPGDCFEDEGEIGEV